METIVEPKQRIAKIWGEQKINSDVCYRLMKYVYKAKQYGLILLHNLVTGQLVILDKNETDRINVATVEYNDVLDELIKGHFLVPVDYDEHKQVFNIRLLLRKLYVKKTDVITNYTVLPTTACNARCYYCFEAGVKTTTMTEQTANDLVDFIKKNCGDDKHIHITWFGGEPTVAVHRIDQICAGLNKEGITYSSKVITNAFLLDEELVQKAKSFWNTMQVQISVDGIEDNYNKIKNYINQANSNPYRTVLRNIRYLIDNEIYVDFRMNFDMNNYGDFKWLVDDILKLYGNNPFLNVYVHPIIGDYKDVDGCNCHGDEEWFRKKLVELSDISLNAGLSRMPNELPSLSYKGCRANNDIAVVVTPEGNLVKCPELITNDQVVGSLKDGITNYDLINKWKQFVDYEKCINCFYYPVCEKAVFCSTKDRCDYYLKFKHDIEQGIVHLVLKYKEVKNNEI